MTNGFAIRSAGATASNRGPHVVVISGAAGGIGQALCRFYNENGHTVVALDVTGSDVRQLDGSLGNGSVAFECDISDESEVVDTFGKIDRRFGQIDILVNNAAIGPVMRPTVETEMDGLRDMLDVNFLGAFFLARESASTMARGGAIVNVASLGGILPNPCRNAYAASKAALLSLTKSLACEWASNGIRVCAVAPGYVKTPMVGDLERAGRVNLSAVRRRIPIGRVARPDEIARAVFFLGSERAEYVTGSVLAVDGGWASFNQPGDAHPEPENEPPAELDATEGNGSGRNVLVTGAGNGIGAEIARKFAAGGDRVIAIDGDSSALESVASSLGENSHRYVVDLTRDGEVLDLFARLRETIGRLDVLVNCAAIADSFEPAFDQNGSDLGRVLDVNLSGLFLCTREALDMMDTGGCILNIGSINTFLPFSPRHAYGASKAAIHMLTGCMAAELGPQGIRINTIAPGYVRTPGLEALIRDGRVDEAMIRRRIPLGVLGRPEDIAAAASFLASDDASYITGSILYIDGGWTSFGSAGFASEPASEHF